MKAPTPLRISSSTPVKGNNKGGEWESQFPRQQIQGPVLRPLRLQTMSAVQGSQPWWWTVGQGNEESVLQQQPAGNPRVHVEFPESHTVPNLLHRLMKVLAEDLTGLSLDVQPQTMRPWGMYCVGLKTEMQRNCHLLKGQCELGLGIW